MSEDEIKKQLLAYAEAAGGIEIDAQGRPVLRGLSFDESEAVFSYEIAGYLKKLPTMDRDRYLELRNKHDLARIEAVVLMADARDKPKN